MIVAPKAPVRSTKYRAPDAHVWERLNYIRLLDGWRSRPGAR